MLISYPTTIYASLSTNPCFSFRFLFFPHLALVKIVIHLRQSPQLQFPSQQLGMEGGKGGVEGNSLSYLSLCLRAFIEKVNYFSNALNPFHVFNSSNLGPLKALFFSQDQKQHCQVTFLLTFFIGDQAFDLKLVLSQQTNLHI